MPLSSSDLCQWRVAGSQGLLVDACIVCVDVSELMCRQASSVLDAYLASAISLRNRLVQRTAHLDRVHAMWRGAYGSTVYRFVLFYAQLHEFHICQLDELALKAVNCGTCRVRTDGIAIHSWTIGYFEMQRSRHVEASGFLDHAFAWLISQSDIQPRNSRYH